MIRHLAVAALIAAALAAPAITAQQPARPPGDSLAAVVVTASRVPVATLSPLTSSTVLEGDDLRAQGITRVEDALRLVPGAQVVSGGPVGSQTSLFLRGGNSNYVRVLVDGVPVNEAGGAFDWASLTTDNVERIEVVRGPASVLYGSDAVSGVVQIFTRTGKGPLATNAYAGVASRGGRQGELGWSGGTPKAGFTLSGAHRSTDGILPFNNEFVDDVLSASLRLAPDGKTDFGMTTRWSSQSYHYPTESDGSVVDRNAEQTDHRFVVSLDAGRRLGRRAELHLSLVSDQYLPRSNDGPDSPADTLGFYGYYSRAAETHQGADARLDLHYGRRGVFTIGEDVTADREDQTSLSLSQYGNTPDAFRASRHNAATFVQAIGDAGRLSYVAGGRVDRNSAFGTFATTRAGVAYVLSADARVRASVGSAFTAPSFYQNFATGYVTGNPDLRPERSRSAELGLDAVLDHGNLTLKTTAYVQQFDDIIDYAGVAPRPGAPNYFNVAAANANGVELEYAYRAAGGVTLSGSYAYTDTRATTIGFDSTTGASYVPGQPLLRRPRNAWSLSALQVYPGGSRLDLVIAYVGARADRDYTPYPAVPVTLRGYTKVDLSVVQPVPSHLRGGVSLEARVDNVFGARYEEIVHFPAPGRTVAVGIRIGK